MLGTILLTLWSFQAWRKAILTHVLRNDNVFTKRILNNLETMNVNHVELSGLHMET